jgi:hypothetical protein
MNPLTLLRSVEDLLYEVVSWLLFYPRTLLMTLRHPIRTMDYSDREQRDKPEKQYLETLSPPLFLVLSLIIAHGLEVAAGLNEFEMNSSLGAIVTGNQENLLAFRALAFSLAAVAFAAVSLRLQTIRLDRETLQAPFFAQCYLSGAMAMVVGVGSIGIRHPGEIQTIGGVALTLAGMLWYLRAQYSWLRARAHIKAATALCLALGVAGSCYVAVIAIVWLLLGGSTLSTGPM